MNKDNIFYSVLKNEDATPYVGNNVLIVADGLGGSGSNVHEIKTDEETSLHDSIFEAAFKDFNCEDSHWQEYLEHLIEPMADEKYDTSALWASRIAIARCAYALCYHQDFSQCDLSDDKERDRLAAFISKGLQDTKEYFDLQRGKYDDQKILPTTLAFIRYNTEENGVTTAEVVWAGDSRCYLLSQDGLKQLSIDDEDQSGAITNLFYVGSKNTVLNYRKYTIQGPCVLIGASDGIFDPFEPHDNFGVEWILLKSISEAMSYQDLMAKLDEFYGRVHADDATMAFVPIGFENYDALKQSLLDRTQSILKMWDKYCETKSALEIVNSPEIDVKDYVESRTRDKLSSIMTMILQNYKNSDDCIYTEELRDTIEQVKKSAREERRRKKVQESICKLQADIKSDKGKIQVGDIFNINLEGLPKEISDLIKSVEERHANLRDALDKKSNKEKQVKEIEKKRQIIQQRVEYYWQEFNAPRKDDKKCDVIAKALKLWIDIKVAFEKGEGFSMYKSYKFDDKEIIDNIGRFIRDNKKLLKLSNTDMDKDIEAKQENFNTAIDNLFIVLKGNSSDYEKIFTREVVQEYQLATQDQNDTDDNIADEVQTFVTKYKDEIVSAIVEALANNCDKESMIDGFYNATRLGSFRTYYRLKNNPNMGIEEFKAELNELEEAYSQLLKD